MICLESQLVIYGYGYVIRKETIEEFTTGEKVENILNSITRELTKDEKTLLEIYEKSKNIPNDEHAEDFSEPKKFCV